MMKYRWVLSALAVFAILFASVVRSAVAEPQKVKVFIHLHDAATGEAVPHRDVYLIKAREVAGGGFEADPRRGFETGETDGNGAVTITLQYVRNIGMEPIDGTWVVEYQQGFGGNYKSASKTIFVDGHHTDYEVPISLERRPNRISGSAQAETRTLHIRVRGRIGGALVPVHYATIYNPRGDLIATTDYNGFARITHSLPMGELYVLHAEATPTSGENGNFIWEPATASFTVGASEGGSRLTRVDDYINFVMGGKESAPEENELIVHVRGMQHSKRVPIRYATIYDAGGHEIMMTGYNGNGTAKVRSVPLGETYVISAEANHWKTASETVTSGTRSGGSTAAMDSASFILEPDVTAAPLIVEVLDHKTDKPIEGASVTLYKPSGFPGTAVGHATTDAKGEATFESDVVAEAELQGATRVGAKHPAYTTAIQSVSAAAASDESQRYVMYLKSGKGAELNRNGSFVGPEHTANLSGSGTSLNGTFNYVGPAGHGGTQTLAGCKVSGSIAHCMGTGEYHDPDKSISYGGPVTVTLSGDSVTIVEKVTSATAAWKSGVEPYASAVSVGAVFTVIVHRKGKP